MIAAIDARRAVASSQARVSTHSILTRLIFAAIAWGTATSDGLIVLELNEAERAAAWPDQHGWFVGDKRVQGGIDVGVRLGVFLAGSTPERIVLVGGEGR